MVVSSHRLVAALVGAGLLVTAAPARGAAKPPVPTVRRNLAPHYAMPAKGRVKIAFFDADKTLRVSKSGKPTADYARDVVLLPDVAPKIASLAAQGYLIAVVSNQAGVAAGYITQNVADSALRYTSRLLAKEGAPVHYYDFAEGRGKDRKPGRGMGERLVKALHAAGKQVDWKRSIMVGDAGYKHGVDLRPDGSPGEDFSNSDRRFADNMRKRYSKAEGAMTFHHPADFFGWSTRGVRNITSLAEMSAYLEAR